MKRASYHPSVVTEFFKRFGIPAPEYEYRFHTLRKWRFYLAWPAQRLYLEVDGGIWVRGGHNRGAQMLKDWDKRNTATVLGWRGLWCQPKDLCTETMATIIAEALHADS